MKKQLTYLLVIFSLLFATCGNCQVIDVIKDNLDNNNRSSGNEGSQDYSSGDFDGCAEVCCYSCFDYGCIFMMDVFMTLNDELLKKEDEIPRLQSLDFSISAGTGDSRNYLYVPKFTWNGGILSTELRWHHSLEKHLLGWDNLGTLDWQFLMVNLLPLHAFNWNMGTGLIYIPYSSDVFLEATTAFDIYFADRFLINLEGRSSFDDGNDKFFRNEVGLGLYYLFAARGNALWSVFINYSYYNYYESINTSALSMGLSLRLDY